MSGYSAESGRQADPERIIDRIHRAEARAGYHGKSNRSKKLDWNDPDHRAHVRGCFDDPEGEESILPGFGPDGKGGNARDDCGDAHPFVCGSCGHSVEFGRTCSQSVCGRCGVAWCRDSAIAKTAKLRRIRKEKDWHTSDREHQKFHHQIISPPLGWFATLARDGYSLRDALDETLAVVKDVLDEMRAQGLVIRHSYRGAREDGSVADESDDRGAWKERLNSGRAWVDDVRDELAWMPHFHCIVVSDFLKGDGFSDRIEDATGWVIHRIANDDGVSIPDDGTMAKVSTYSLSHIDVERGANANRSIARWVGAFEGDVVKSSGRFTAKDHDVDWADAKVRDVARDVLGLRSGTTDCGADLPAVDDPDELARRILNELYPGEDTSDVEPDHVLHHVAEGNISIDVETTAGGGGNVTVRDAFGEPVANGWGTPGDLPTPSAHTAVVDGGGEAVAPVVDGDQEDGGDGCGHDHDDADGCDGTLIPLGEARRRGIIDDPKWQADAPHADEARAADREWPDDLDPWRVSSPGNAIGAGG